MCSLYVTYSYYLSSFNIYISPVPQHLQILATPLVPMLILIFSGEHVHCTYSSTYQNSFYNFRMVVTHVTFGLLAVAVFL